LEQKELLRQWIQQYYDRLTYVAFTYVQDQSRDKEIYAAIMALPEKFRMPIILYYFEELSIREIADALKRSIIITSGIIK
jgi:RNA polymerase sigma-70 factor (ECF subfamily)